MEQYYLKMEKKLLKKAKKFFYLIEPELHKHYGKLEASKIIDEAVGEYKSLIPLFPYVGGKENNLTAAIIQSNWALALYRALLKHDGSAKQVGELMATGVVKMMDKIPFFIRKYMGKKTYNDKGIAKMNKIAKKSQEKKYPLDWVWSIKKCDGGSCDVAIDYTECGIYKFFNMQGAAELVPYICKLDYILFEKLGLKLTRTQTVADGHDCCDFRINYNA